MECKLNKFLTTFSLELDMNCGPARLTHPSLAKKGASNRPVGFGYELD